MDKDKGLKFLGLACMIIGGCISVIQKQLDDRKLEDLVDKKVQEKLNKK